MDTPRIDVRTLVIMRASQISTGFLSAFLMTTFTLQWWQQTSYPWFIPAAGIGLIALSLLLSRIFRNTREACIILAFVVVGSLGAFMRVAQTTHITTPHSVESLADEREHTLRGVIAAAPDRRPLSTRYVIDTSGLQDEEVWRPITGRILVRDQSQRHSFRYGDTVIVRGIIERPMPIEGFAYDRYLSISRIYALMNEASLREWEGGPEAATHGSIATRAYRSLISAREWIEDVIARIFPEPQSSLLAGLLTGSRRGMPDGVTQDFRTTGLSHITAISGYNITVILALLSSLLFWVPVKRRLVPLVIGIGCFTIFVGGSSSVVRAAIMGVLGLLALQAERQADMKLAVLWTAFAMAAWNPSTLWYDAGFHLSFLAIIGIMTFSPWLSRRLSWITDILAIRTSLIATLAAQLGTLPIMIISFGQLSLIAPLANILVAPLIPLAMASGFLAVLAGGLWLPLGLLVGLPAHFSLTLIATIARTLAGIPFASLTWP